MPTLRTGRLVLRPITVCDEDALHRFWTNPEVRRYLWDDAIISRATVSEIIAVSERFFHERGSGLFAIELNERPGELMGFCGHRAFEQGEDVELLYGIVPHLQGEGLVTEAATEILRFGFDDCGFLRVIAVTDTPNQRAVNVLRRLGMVFTCRRQWHGLDTVFYSLDRTDFRRPA
jgi:RimJ/RimL family protein N-acetyltransferase